MATEIRPRALHVDEACKVAGIGKSKLYLMIAAGELRARKCGKRTLILADDLERWLEALPVELDPPPDCTPRRRAVAA